MTAKIEVAHFGELPLKAVNPSWKITQNSQLIAEGTFGQRDIPIGNAFQLGEVIIEFQKENVPRKLNLKVDVGGFENSWEI